MSIIKLTGLALVALCAAGMGAGMALSLTERVRALETSLAVLDAMYGELSYSLAPPDEIVCRLAQRETLTRADYLCVCRRLGETGMPFPQAWEQALRTQSGMLSAQDVDTLASLSDTLGRCSLEEALAEIRRVRAALAAELEQAREFAGTHGKLYRTLGMLSAVFLVILWI